MQTLRNLTHTNRLKGRDRQREKDLERFREDKEGCLHERQRRHAIHETRYIWYLAKEKDVKRKKSQMNAVDTLHRILKTRWLLRNSTYIHKRNKELVLVSYEYS